METSPPPSEAPGDPRHRLRSPDVRELLDRLPLLTDRREFAELLAAAARCALAADRALCRLAGEEGAEGRAPERCLEAAIVDPGGEVLGVLAVARDGGAPFGPDAEPVLEALARHGGALLTILPPASPVAPPGPADGRPVSPKGPEGPKRPARDPEAPEGSTIPLPPHLARLKRGPADVFRREALESHRSRDGEHGNPLELSSGWLRWAFRILVASLAVGLVVLLTVDVAERVSGPAVVRGPGPDGAVAVDVRLPEPAAERVRPGMEGRFLLDAAAGPGAAAVVRSVHPGPDGPRADLALVEPPRDGGYRGGVTGRAEIVVRRVPILHSLLPGLRSLRGDDRSGPEAEDG